MTIDWNALGQVFGVSLVLTVTLVGVFTLGIVATSRKTQQTSGAVNGGPGATSPASSLARSGGYLCFALCAMAVAYGINIIVA